jgi:BirA family biotin operon repressor/biotin-[acetyl-CoA-carboxylase] ligase
VIELGRPLHRIEQVGSTMTWARAEVEGGRASPGAAFLAEAQTAGRGRHGRSWSSSPGKGLYLTVVLPESLAEASVTLAGALATAEAVERVWRVSPRIKWPNDLVVGERKLGGVLGEIVPVADHSVVLLGIGVNVGQEEADFGSDPGPQATSLRLLLGVPVEPRALLPELFGRLRERLEAFERGGFGALASGYLARAAFEAGDRLDIERDGEPVLTATFRGLDPAGRLLVEETPQPLPSGTVLRVRRRRAP